MWYINMPVDKQRDFRRRRNTWKTVKNKYFIQNALCFANSQDKATNFATVISWIRCNAERAAGCVLILSDVFLEWQWWVHISFVFYCGQLLISTMRCRIICGYASWQVTSQRALGLSTLLRWSTCGLRVPGSKNSSLIGPSHWALSLNCRTVSCFASTPWKPGIWVFIPLLGCVKYFLVCARRAQEGSCPTCSSGKHLGLFVLPR